MFTCNAQYLASIAVQNERSQCPIQPVHALATLSTGFEHLLQMLKDC